MSIGRAIKFGWIIRNEDNKSMIQMPNPRRQWFIWKGRREEIVEYDVWFPHFNRKPQVEVCEIPLVNNRVIEYSPACSGLTPLLGVFLYYWVILQFQKTKEFYQNEELSPLMLNCVPYPYHTSTHIHFRLLTRKSILITIGQMFSYTFTCFVFGLLYPNLFECFTSPAIFYYKILSDQILLRYKVGMWAWTCFMEIFQILLNKVLKIEVNLMHR